MRFNVLLLTVLFASLVSVQAQADEDSSVLSEIGKHSVHPSLQTKKDLWKMMRTPKVWGDIQDALKRAECLGTKTGKCIDLANDIRNLFPDNYDEFQEKKSGEIRDKIYKKDSVQFYWMMFRSNGKGKIKLSQKITWGGYYSLPAYEFSIPYKNLIYVFTVPKECGNLALLKDDCTPKHPECPNPCEDCAQCLEDCKRYGRCESDKCQTCWKEKCFVPVEITVNECEDCPGPKCPEKCKVPVPCPDNCSDCSKECWDNPDGKGCEPQCRQCKEQNCFTDCPKVPCPDNCSDCSKNCRENPDGIGCESQCKQCKEQNCFTPCPDDCPSKCKDDPAGEECRECKDLKCFTPINIRFVGDVGYFRQSDPADYLFGRVGVEYSPFEQGSPFENVSLLTMIGAASKVGGSDGDSAFLLDLLAQYNWSEPFKGGFVGLGFGGWFTSGDAEDDSADSDLDFIANIGFKVLDEPDMSIFFEMRNAVDELDGIAEYGRFGAGLRFRF